MFQVQYNDIIHSGYGHLMILLNIVQNECDTWSITILDKFKYERKLASKISRVKSVMSNTHSQSINLDKPDPMDLESLISEIVLINTRVELYLRFLRRRLQVDAHFIDKVSNDICPSERL